MIRLKHLSKKRTALQSQKHARIALVEEKKKSKYNNMSICEIIVDYFFLKN